MKIILKYPIYTRRSYVRIETDLFNRAPYERIAFHVALLKAHIINYDFKI